MPRASLSDIAEDTQPSGRASLSDIAEAPVAENKPPALRPPTMPERIAGGVSRTLGNLPASAANYMAGMVGAVASPGRTLAAIGDIPVGLYEKLGGPTPESWGKQGERQAEKNLDRVGNHLRSRYDGVSNAIETLESDPVGFASDASAVLGGAAGLAKAAGVGRVAKYASAASEAANPMIGPARGAAAVAKKVIPQGKMLDVASDLYQSAVKVPPSWHKPEDLKQMLNTAMDEGIKLDFSPSSGGAYRQVGRKIDDINQTVKGKIKDGAARGLTVDPEKVAAKTARSQEAFTTANPDDVKPVADVRQKFLDAHSVDAPYTKIIPSAEGDGFVPVGEGSRKVPQPIPVDQAHRLKQNTYRKLQDTAFDGQTPSAVRETSKDLARGLKEGVYEHFPELQKLGQHERVLIDLQDALERFSNRHGNRDVVGLAPAVMAAENPLAAVVKGALDNPGVKSRIAIALRKAALNQKRPNAGALRQKINVAEAVNNAVQDQQQ